jgi:hypothetical protein
VRERVRRGSGAGVLQRASSGQAAGGVRREGSVRPGAGGLNGGCGYGVDVGVYGGEAPRVG